MVQLLLLTALFLLSFLPNKGLKCTTNLDNIDYLSENFIRSSKDRIPPLIISPFDEEIYTKIGYLLSSLTGYHIGSVVIDDHEKVCGLRTIGIQGYLNYFDDSDINSRGDGIPLISLQNKASRVKCRKGVIREFNRIVLIVRDPLVSISSRWTGHIPDNESNENIMTHAIDGAKEYNHDLQRFIIPILMNLPDKDFLILKFEDVFESRSGHHSIHKLLNFLDLDIDVSRSQVDNSFNRTLATCPTSNHKVYMNDPWINARKNCSYIHYIKFFNIYFNYSVDFSHCNEEEMSDQSGNVAVRDLIKCKDHFGQVLSYNNLTSKESIPLLVSFPGSGNTWMRLLIEFSTGYTSGSIYHYDAGLYNSFRHEKYCLTNNIVVKAHPQDLKYNNAKQVIELFDNIETEYRPMSTGVTSKCGNVSFKRAILLIRDPYSSIIAEYQRRRTSSHIGTIHSNETFTQDNINVNNEVRKLAIVYQERWTNLLQPLHRNHPSHMVLTLKYESLLDPKMRSTSLTRAYQFLLPNADVDLYQLQCAFTLADKPFIHRKKSQFKTLLIQHYPDILCTITSYLVDYLRYYNYTSLCTVK